MQPTPLLSLLHQAHVQTSLHLDRALADLGVTAQEAQLLAFVAVRGKAAIGSVRKLLGCPKSTLTSLLRRLAGRQLIALAANQDDRRSGLVVATPAGAALGEQARQRVLALETQLQARVAAADRRALERLVAAINDLTGLDLPAEHPLPNHRNPQE